MALVPVAEVIETLAPGAPGAASDRRREIDGPRAAICAAGQRGTYRKVWVPPLDALGRLARHETGLYLAPRVSLARERIARDAWPLFVGACASAGDASDRSVSFLAKVAQGETVGTRRHVWIEVAECHAEGGSGTLTDLDGARETIDFTLAEVGDWRVVGLPGGPSEGPLDIGPEQAALLERR